MKEYFVIMENNKIGPLTYEQLSTYKINTETLVWYKGLKDWEKAKNLEELNDLIDGPPPIIIDKKLERNIRNKRVISSFKKAALYSLLVGIIVFCISAILYDYPYYMNPNYENIVWGDETDRIQFGDFRNLKASNFYGNIEISLPVDYNGNPVEFRLKEEERKYFTTHFINILKGRIYEYKNHILLVSGIYCFIGFLSCLIICYTILIRRTNG